MLEYRPSTSLLGANQLHMTLPISRDDDAERQGAPRDDDVQMPDAPTVHDVATPRRQIGGRCRTWCSDTQPTSDKRKCAANCMCGQQFSHGEARLQQWCNRNTQRAHVHAHCVKEEMAMIMSCTQSNPWIRKQLNPLLASAQVSSGRRHRGSPTLACVRVRACVRVCVRSGGGRRPCARVCGGSDSAKAGRCDCAAFRAVLSCSSSFSGLSCDFSGSFASSHCLSLSHLGLAGQGRVRQATLKRCA